MLTVAFLNTTALPRSVRSKTPLLATAIQRALAPAKASGEVAVQFLGYAAMRKLNHERLGHDYVTDVIAFPYESAGDDTPFGDIAICVPQANRQAKELRHDLLTELLTLAAHGALHLIGYDDHKPAARKKMFAQQDTIVRAIRAPFGKP